MVTQPVLNREEELDLLEDHVLEALRLARKAGARDAEVNAHTSQGLSVTARLGEVETLEHMQDRGVSVTVFIGNRKGNANSADLRRDSMEECVRRAIDIARYTQEDKANGLADRALLRLAQIVNAADTGRFDNDALAPGLEAIAVGYSLRYPDDIQNIERQFEVYDALYAWCRLETAKEKLLN